MRTLQPVQRLPNPPNSPYEHFGLSVAIEGSHIIVLAIDEGTTSRRYAALLYRRNSDGSWAYRRTLVNVARIAATERGGASEIGTVERLRLIASMGALAERLRA